MPAIGGNRQLVTDTVDKVGCASEFLSASVKRGLSVSAFGVCRGGFAFLVP
jgi:hypothetical protein